jgi:hypothetical protein
MPMWEHICGQCGTKQAPLLEDRRGEMAARQAEAEGLLKDYDFDHAERITASLRDESDPRLKQLVPWATEFVAKIGKAREAQFAQAGVRLAEALKHEASFDYPSSVHALEQVPEILRKRIPNGHADSVQAALDRISEKQTEVERLEAFIKARITSRDLSGLLPEVRKLLQLRPDRADVKKVCSQLEDRQQKLIAQRDEAISLARRLLDSHDYESVVSALHKVDESVETPDVDYMRSEATARLKRLKTLMQDIRVATNGQKLDGLLEKVEEALQLKPGHGELVKLRENLHARFIKINEQVFAAVDQASQLARSCRFAEAESLLGKIPQPNRSDLIRADLQCYDALARARAAAAHAIKAATPATYEEACGIANAYELLLQPTGISDPEFSVALQGLRDTLASHLRTQRWISMFRNAAAATAVGAVVVVAGLWLRSSRWAEALLEPGGPNDSRNLVPANASARTSGPTEQTGPAERSCLNGCLLVRVPDDFVGLSQQELESKYPGYSNATNPIEEWASRDGTLSVAVTAVRLSAIPGSPNNLTDVQDFMEAQLRRNPSFSARKWKTQTINGQEWMQVDYEATVDSKRCQEVSAMTVVNSRMLSVTFKAFSQRRNEWLSIRDEVFQSLKVTCP